MSPLLNDIALFVEVAKTKSFTRAAEALNMPVSTLSRRIREMELEIGVPLLKRSTRKVEVSEAGAVYFERCQSIVAEAKVAHEQLLEMSQQPKGRLRVSMPASFSLHFMTEILQDFGREYPDIECDIDLSIRPIDLLADSFDLIIRFGRQPDSSVISRQIASVPLGLFATPAYLAKHGVPLKPADLARHECLRSSTSKEDSVWELHCAGQVERVAVAGRLALNNVSMLHRMALKGVGIVALSIGEFVGQGAHEGLQRVLPDWQFCPVPLLALFPSRLMSVKTRVFLDFVQARLNLSNN